MRFSSLTLLALLYGDSQAFQPHGGSVGRKSLAVEAKANNNKANPYGGVEETRWETMDKRTSFSNSGPGLPPGNYDFNFTPLNPVTRDYERTVDYYAPENPAQESRWEEIDTRTSLRNSGPGAPPARYDISFTPLHPVATDYEQTVDYYIGDAPMKESRWDDMEKRTSLVNSGAGSPVGNYDYTFTPLPPVARDYESTIRTYTTDSYKESRWDDIDKRTSLVNSGPGAFPGNYDYTCTPLAPKAKDYERTKRAYASFAHRESRWDEIETRTSLVNSGPGPLPGQYDVNFTPKSNRGRDYERILYEYGAPGYSLIQSRWDMLDKRTSLMNSGSGSPVANYDIPFTPLPPVARDYERTISYYVEPDLETSRWASLEQRESLSNSGPGKPQGGYEMDFTPLPPRTSGWYPQPGQSPEQNDGPLQLPGGSKSSSSKQLPGAKSNGSKQLPGSKNMPLPGQSKMPGQQSKTIDTVQAYNLNK